MKKYIWIILLICLCLALIGCSTEINSGTSQNVAPNIAIGSKEVEDPSSKEENIPSTQNEDDYVANQDEELNLPLILDIDLATSPKYQFKKPVYDAVMELYNTSGQYYHGAVIPIFHFSDYQIRWEREKIVIAKNNWVNIVYFEDVRRKSDNALSYLIPMTPEELDGVSANILGSTCSYIYTDSQLYFVFLVEIGSAQNFQFYRWDLETEELIFVTEYPGCGILDEINIENKILYIFAVHSYIPGKNFESVIDLETGVEIKREIDVR